MSLSSSVIKKVALTLTTNTFHNYHGTTKAIGYNGQCLRSTDSRLHPSCPPYQSHFLSICTHTLFSLHVHLQYTDMPIVCCLPRLSDSHYTEYRHIYVQIHTHSHKSTHAWFLALDRFNAARGWSICVDLAFSLFPFGFLFRLHQAVSATCNTTLPFYFFLCSPLYLFP